MTHLDHCSDTLEVPDNHMGGVLGRNSQRICFIAKVTDCAIDVAEKGNFIPGTNNRFVVTNKKYIHYTDYMYCDF